MSQGTACLVAGAFGGFPVGGSVSRTSLARLAGAQSRLAQAVTGACVLAFLCVGGPILAYLPKAVLGGLVSVAVYPLLKPSDSLLARARARPRASARTRAAHARALCASGVGSAV